MHHPIQTLVVAISSRALFDLTESHEGFRSQAVDAYHDYQSANKNQQLRIAIDGDAVLFSDEAFTKDEVDSAKTPLLGSSFKKFLVLLHGNQSGYPAENSPIRTTLITARAAPAGERAIRTFRAWTIRIQEAIFKSV